MRSDGPWWFPKCNTCLGREQTERNPATRVLGNLRVSAKKRRVPCNITLAEFRVWCEETGFLEMKRGRKHGSKSIGRIDHSKGYSIANIQVEDYMFNAVKGHTIPDRPDTPQNHSDTYEDPF